VSAPETDYIEISQS
jgi:hypothetical protein